MAPGFVAAAFRHRRDTRILLEFFRGGVAFRLFTKRDEEARGKDCASAWQGGKSGEIGRLLGALRNGVVEVCNGLQDNAERGDEGLNPEGIGAIPPSSVVSGVALLMAWRRLSMTLS
jgi:hypothetical protein